MTSKYKNDFRGKESTFTGGGPHNGPPKSTQFAPSTKLGEKSPMKRLTDQDWEQYKKEGRCFHCHELGHGFWQCPKNKKVASMKHKKQETPVMDPSSSQGNDHSQ